MMKFLTCKQTTNESDDFAESLSMLARCLGYAREPLAASASRGQGPESVHQAPGGVDRRPVYPAFWTCTMAAGHLGQYHVCRVYSSRT